MAEIGGAAAQGNEPMPHVLIVDDEESVLGMVYSCLKLSGYRVSTARSAEDASRLVEGNEFDTVLTDVQMPGEDGIAFLAGVHRQRPDMPVIVMTGFAQLQTAVNAIKSGAFDFLYKPFDFSYLTQVVKKAVEHARLRRMEKRYRAELEETVAQRTDELKEALAQLEVTRAALLKAANDKNEFMSTITHEMRTPMNGVIGALDLLADAALSGPQQEYLLLARHSAENMMTLVDSLLSFSDGIGRGPAICYEAFDLPHAVEALALGYRSRFTGKGLSFDVRVAPTVPRRIRCDREQLVRLLDILLGNALKFTERGGGSLEVSPELTGDQRAAIRVTVSDSGIGIPEEMIERIFEPFIQVDGSLTRRFGGAGLGLSIARQIALLLDGRIWAESHPGRGSSFHLLMNVVLP